MRLREFTHPDKYFLSETDLPDRPGQPEKDRNDHSDVDGSLGVTRKPAIRDRPRRADPTGFSRR
jgi:hypothetical protein